MSINGGKVSVILSLGAVVLSAGGIIFQGKQNAKDIEELSGRVALMSPASELARKDVTNIQINAMKQELVEIKVILKETQEQSRKNGETLLGLMNELRRRR